MSKLKESSRETLQDIFLDYSNTTPGRASPTAFAPPPSSSSPSKVNNYINSPATSTRVNKSSLYSSTASSIHGYVPTTANISAPPVTMSLHSRDNREESSNSQNVFELWKRASTELKAKSKELAELKASLRQSTNGSLVDVMEANTLDLKDKLRFLERQLQIAREQNDRWGQSYDDVTNQLRIAESANIESKSILTEQAHKIKQLEDALQGADKERNNIIGRSLAEIRNHDEGLLAAQRALSNKNSMLSDAQQKMMQLNQDYIDAQSKIQELNAQLQESQAEARETRRMLSASLDELKSHRSIKMNEQQLRVEIQHLKLDNARMIRLLAATDEYQSWLRMAKFSNGVSYIPPSTTKENSSSRGGDHKSPAARKSSKVGGSSLADFGIVKTLAREYGGLSQDDADINPSDEARHWIPTDAVKLSIDFKHRHLPNVPMSLITEYLKQLNAIWHRREVSHVNYIKEKSTRCLQDLRRQVSQRVPYEEIVQKKMIDRLKADLTRERVRNAAMASANSRMRDDGGVMSLLSNPIGGDPGLIETSLATIESLSQQVAELHRENQKLRSEQDDAGPLGLGLSERGASSLGLPANKQKNFLSGAQWMGLRASSIVEKLRNVESDLVNAYKRKALQLGGGATDITTNLVYHEELIAAINKATQSCYDGIQRLLDEAPQASHLEAFYPDNDDTHSKMWKRHANDNRSSGVKGRLQSDDLDDDYTFK